MSAWAQERFGTAATALSAAVPLAIVKAHEFGIAAQASSGTRRKDPYGHTLKVRQHECLAEACRDIPGVQLRRPAAAGSPFELVTVEETAVVLYPWRYATDGSRRRTDARMNTSAFRLSLLAGAPQRDGQLTIEQGMMDSEALEALIAEEEALLSQLAQFGVVVTIGYACNADAGLFDLGWGDAELLDESGRVQWHYWEPLSPPKSGGGSVPVDPGSGQPAAPAPASPFGPRFDAAPLDDDFELRPRSPLEGTPTHEREAPAPDTGTEDEQ